MPYFFCRLDPPRPTFPGDMTEEEGALMAAHAAYWREKADAGIVLAMGPAGTMQSAIGVGVILAPDAETANALTENDPIAKSGRGFRMEAIPMFGMIRSKVVVEP